MIGAKINGMIVPIDRIPQNGEIVEILTSTASKGPSRDWLKIIRTSEARNKIRQWFKKEKRAENILFGRDETEKIFKQFNRSFTDDQRETVLINISKREGFENVDDFYNAIGYGGVSITKTTFKMKEEVEKIIKEQNDELIFDVMPVEFEQAKPYSDNTLVIVDGMDNCQIKLSKCCNPLPGDDICGFVTKGHGLSIHKTDCENYIKLKLLDENKDRIFTTFWNSDKIKKEEHGDKKNFKSMLKITAVNDLRLIPAIASLLADMKVSIHSISEVKIKSDGSVVLNLLISARDVDHLNHIINRLKTVKNITEADRSGG
jgi:GTP pyrophosphokinase